MKYSIIIPVYNVEKYLDRCLNSVINQTYKNIEIIIINDGSTDNSKIICNSYKKKDKRIKYFEQKNSGVSIARNVGLENSTGDYVIFIDSDDYVEINAIDIINNHLENKTVDLMIFNYKKLIASTNEIYEIKYKNLDNFSLEYIIHNEKLMIRGYLWNKVFKKDSIIEKFKSQHCYMEDLCFIQENINFFKSFEIIYDSPYYIYNVNDGSIMNGTEFNEKRISALYTALYIINITSFKCSCFQKVNLMKNYCRLRYNNSKYKDVRIEKYIKIFLKDVLKSKYLSIKDKIYSIIWVKMPFIYKIKRYFKG